jgi:hypothetical protein
MIYSLIIVSLAAFFNGIMDTVENENFFKSIFGKLDQSFWYKRESWKSAEFLPGTKYHPDAWHGSKSFMIFFFLLSATFYDNTFERMFEPFVRYYAFCGKALYVALTGTEFILVFNLFYNVVLRSKKTVRWNRRSHV